MLDSSGQCPLHKAAQNGWLECVQFLLEKGAGVNMADKSGSSIVKEPVAYDITCTITT